jgi:hypothetical protein
MHVGASLARLLPRLEANHHASCLLHFALGPLSVRGILFVKSRTILVGVEALNTAWYVPISDGGYVSGWIPQEAFSKLLPILAELSSPVSTKPFFDSLAGALAREADSDRHAWADEAEIIKLLERCPTRDSRYGKDGPRPFFHYWRRVPPSNQSLDKIGDYFGRRVQAACYRGRVTAVWSNRRQADSLGFLEPDRALEEIRYGRKPRR